MSEFLKRQLMSLQNQAGADGGDGGSGGQGPVQINFEDPAIKAQLDQYVEQHVSGLKAKNNELLGKNKTLSDELTNFKGQFEGLDIGAVKGLLQKAGQDEETKLLAEGKIDEVFGKRTERLKAEHQKLFDAEKARADKAEAYANKFKQSVVKGQIAQAFSAAQGLSEATDDITALALSKFSLDENGNAVAIDANGDVIIGKDGKNPLTPKEWIEDIRESKPYFFPKPNGAGGQGGNNSGSKNTIKRSEFDAMNPTEKANYIRKGGNVID